MKKFSVTALMLTVMTLAASCGTIANMNGNTIEPSLAGRDSVTMPPETTVEAQTAVDSPEQTTSYTPEEKPIEGIISVESGSPEATAKPKPYEPPVLDKLPEDIGYSEGRYLEAKGGGAMILIDNYGPCSMSRAEASVSFDGLTSGDKIKVGYQLIMETYPGQMPVFTVEKLEDGKFDDLDRDTLIQLASMGWVDMFKIIGDVQYIRTDGYNEIVSYPYLVKVTSKAELESYTKVFSDIFDLGSKSEVYSDTTIGFADAIEKYDDAYFENNLLYMAVLEEGSGSVQHEVKDIAGGFFRIDSIAPEVCTDDMAEWHILIEAPVGLEMWGVNAEENNLCTVRDAIAMLQSNTWQLPK